MCLRMQAKVGGERAGGNGAAHSTDHVRASVIRSEGWGLYR